MAMPLYALTGKFRFNFQMNVPGSMQVALAHTHPHTYILVKGTYNEIKCSSAINTKIDF